MGSKPKIPPPPPPAPIPRTADASNAGDAEMLRRRRGSSYANSFLVGNTSLGNTAPTPGATSFLGGQ